MLFKKQPQLVKLPNGKKPNYKQLEEAFLDQWDKTELLKAEVRRLNQENADLRYQLKKHTGK